MLGGSQTLTVSELTDYISRALQEDPHLTDVTVTGELSNFIHHSSGHMYFTLRDKHCSIKGVMFRTWNRLLPFAPEDGQHVYIKADVVVYKKGGNYQLNVYGMEPVGQGALALAFAQLKAKLEGEGLFAPERKRILPKYPRRIGLVTSPQAAALQDFLVTARQQGWPVTFELAPAIVQGAKGAASVVASLELLSRRPLDAIVVMRGGGSLEELWVFNEEAVARAIAASPVPVVSAIGHETDFSISDFVADARAATPTAAARLVIPEGKSLYLELLAVRQKLVGSLSGQIDRRRRKLGHLSSRPALARPLQILLQPRQSLDLGTYRLRTDFSRYLVQRRRDWEGLAARLNALNPFAVLKRGYAVLREETGVIKSIGQLVPGKRVVVQLHDGIAQAEILAVEGEINGTKV